jgi:zinc protease
MQIQEIGISYSPFRVCVSIFQAMKKRNWIFLVFFVYLPLAAWSAAQYETTLLPVDSEVTIGTLENGLTYYVRENSEPQNRAFLRLVVNAGSILEDEDQLGLAHVAEHMAFNGTQKYAASEIIDYLESIGMRFGPEINAYTSFDETVYMLQVPTNDAEKLDMGFDILSQWAFHTRFDPEEIDKERGVVVEEWRTGLGAQDRLRRAQFPILLHNSRYSERLPIGSKEVIESFPYEAITRFYTDWYRPDLMAVIAVGDFETSEIVALITDYFGEAGGSDVSTKRPTYTVPDHEETLFAIASDSELSYSQVIMYNKAQNSVLETRADYRSLLSHRLFGEMINARLSETARSADPPFLAGGAGQTDLVRTKGVSYLAAAVEGNNVAPALHALVEEITRVQQQGFLESEFDRAKRELLRRIERAYIERDNAESESYMQEYTRHFLEDEAIPGIEYEYELYRTIIPETSLEEVNSLVDAYLSEKNRVVVVSAVENEGLTDVEEAELAAAIERGRAGNVDAYDDGASGIPIIADVPGAGAISARKFHEEVAVTEWLLSNGVRVFLKPTDFKNDEIRFTAYSAGGTYLYDEDDYVSATYAASLVADSGIGTLSAINLEKALAGKTVAVSPYIGTIEEGFRGMSSVEDLETLFQLIYGYATTPRREQDAYDNLVRTLETIAQNRASQPSRVFSDRIQALLSSDHYTAAPLTTDRILEIDYDRTHEIFHERFGDFGDFTFVFVGNIQPEDFETLVLTYLALLPSAGRIESWPDPEIARPEGVIVDEVRAGIEPKSQVVLIFHGDYDWSRNNNYLLQSLADSLRIRLREVLREDESGTYGVGVGANFERYPVERYAFQVVFGTSPARAEELTQRTFEIIAEFKQTRLDEIYLTKVRSTQQESFELNIEENGYWVNGIKNALIHGRDLSSILTYPDLVEALDAEDIQTAARRYLDESRFVQVTLYPEPEDE